MRTQVNSSVIPKLHFNQFIKSKYLKYLLFTIFISQLTFVYQLYSQSDSIKIDGKNVAIKDAINSIVNEKLVNENLIKIGEYCINQEGVLIQYSKKNKEKVNDEKFMKTEKVFFQDRHLYETNEKHKIRKVIMSVENASIQNIYVYMEDDSLGIFTNQTNPIHNSVFTNSRRNDRLYSSKGNNSFINVKDVISYSFNDPKYDYLGNQVFILDNNENQCSEIEYDGSMNSIFNLIVYSDLLALLGEQENSLIQFDANLSIPLNQRTIPTDIKFFGGIKLLSHLDLDLVVSKFDSQFEEVGSTLSNDSLIQVNPLSVFQQSYINGKVHFTLASWQLGKVSDISLSVGSVYSLAGIESPNEDSEKIDIDVISYVPKFTFKTNPSPVLTIET